MTTARNDIFSGGNEIWWRGNKNWEDFSSWGDKQIFGC